MSKKGEKKYLPVGKSVVADLYGCNKDLLNDELNLMHLITKCLVGCNINAVSFTYKKFEPHGVTIIAILEESSLDVHTYPEHGIMFVSIFTCGLKSDPEKFVNNMLNSVKHNYRTIKTIERGT